MIEAKYKRALQSITVLTDALFQKEAEVDQLAEMLSAQAAQIEELKKKLPEEDKEDVATE